MVIPQTFSAVNEAVVIQELWIEAETPDFWDRAQIFIKKKKQYGVFSVQGMLLRRKY